MKGLSISLHSQKLWLFHIMYGCESWTIKKSECPRINASGRESRSSWACGLENKLWMDGSTGGEPSLGCHGLGVYQEASQREKEGDAGQRGRRFETK